MMNVARTLTAVLVVVACTGASPAPAPDPTTLIAGLHLKVQQKLKLEARQPVVQETVDTETKIIEDATAALVQAAAPIKAQHSARCFATLPEPEYSSRVRECDGLESQLKQLATNYENEVGPHQKTLDDATAELSTIKQSLPTLGASIRSLKLQLHARFPTCTGDDPEALADCGQHIWDQNQLHTPLSPVLGGGASLGVTPGNDKVLQDYQRQFDLLEGERRTIALRLKTLANEPATAANVAERVQLENRSSAIGSAEAFLRFKAKDRARH